MMTSRKLLIMDSKHSQPERIVRRITSVSTNLILPVEIAPSSTGGEGGGILTSAIQIQGNGEVELGEVTITESGYTWAPKASE